MQAYSYRKLLFNYSYKKKSRRISLRKYWSCLDDDNKKSILISGGGEVGAIEAVGEGGVIEAMGEGGGITAPAEANHKKGTWIVNMWIHNQAPLFSHLQE